MARPTSITGLEYSKFVDSPTRTDGSAIEVVIASGGSGPTENILQQILNAADRVMQITYQDFGNKNQRVTQIDYTASSIGAQIARKTLSYSLVGNRYRRDTITWTII